MLSLATFVYQATWPADVVPTEPSATALVKKAVLADNCESCGCTSRVFLLTVFFSSAPGLANWQPQHTTNNGLPLPGHESGHADDQDDDENVPLASTIPIPAALAPTYGTKALKRPISQDVSGFEVAAIDSGNGGSAPSHGTTSPPNYALDLAPAGYDQFIANQYADPRKGYAFPESQGNPAQKSRVLARIS